MMLVKIYNKNFRKILKNVIFQIQLITNNTSNTFCDTVNNYLPIYLQVGVNQQQKHREKTFAGKTGEPPCKNSIPKGIENFSD